MTAPTPTRARELAEECARFIDFTADAADAKPIIEATIIAAMKEFAGVASEKMKQAGDDTGFLSSEITDNSYGAGVIWQAMAAQRLRDWGIE